MNKPVYGLIVGAVLGVIDGATAWFTPVARPMMAEILIGSSVKGMFVGLAAGFLARKVHSTPIGIVFGALLGLALAYLVAASPLADGKYYYLEIMLPGFIVGAITGFLTQRWNPKETAKQRT